MDFDALRASTLPGLLVERARSRPDRVACRAKELGIHREITWAELAERVGAVALGMAREHGVRRGDTVAILGNPCPEWVIADLAAQALGAVTYGIYPTSASGEIRYLLQHGGRRPRRRRGPGAPRQDPRGARRLPPGPGVLVIDTRVLFMYRDERVHRLADLEQRGRESLRADRDALARLAAAVAAEDPATIVYTSGHHRPPQGRALPARPSHRRVRQHHRALPRAVVARAPGGRDAPALPHHGAQHRDHHAADRRHRASLPGERGHLRGESLRGRAHLHLHGAEVSAEVRRAPPGGDRRQLARQAFGLSGGDGDRPACGGATVAGHRRRCTFTWRARWRGRSSFAGCSRRSALRGRGS